MKKQILLAIVFAMMLMTSCSRYQVIDNQKNNEQFPDYVYNQETAQGMYGHSKMAIAENGYYYIINNILYFYNISSGTNMPLCSKINCFHSDDTCDAYVRGVDAENGIFKCNCMDEKIMFYNGKLYCIEITKDRDYYLYQYDATFNNRKMITKLASVKDEQLFVSDAQACMISEGYLYYYVSFLDSEYVENGYMAQFYICRIKLDGSSSREELGKFDFPGDYAMKAGQSNGLAIYLSDGNIYFYAGGMARMYSAKNMVQYRISKYNPQNNEYTNLWTYTGDNLFEIFGENTGYVNAVSGGDYVKMDSKGNFYIMTSSVLRGGEK